MWFMRVVLALVVGVAVALGPGPALAQGLKLTWWEHANPPHNAYSKDLVAEYNQFKINGHDTIAQNEHTDTFAVGAVLTW